MNLEDTQAMKAHLEAIAQILYRDSNPEDLQTLDNIEQTVRQKVLEYVSPHIGFF
jgi:hypothetical protein